MRTILEYLEATAIRLPRKTAVIDHVGKYTWSTLRITAMSIGSALGQRKFAGKPVPILMEKGFSAIASFLGAAYAGGFYVPLNPELPKARLTQILTTLETDWVLTDKKHQKLAEALTNRDHILYVEDLETAPIDFLVLHTARKNCIDTAPLYAIFTSGSTGVPKGVVVSHRSVIDFIEHFTCPAGITEEDVIGNQAPLDFDVSVKDIYSALKTGATLVLLPKHLFSRPTELLDTLCEHEVTTLIWAVSALCLVSTFHGLDYKTPHSIRRVMFSGEVMPLKHLKQWMEHLPEAQFVNLYGPTEITCNCTCHVLERGRDYSEGIPIGKPFPNEKVFLLGEDNEEVTQADQIGELCVSGTTLSLGYYNAPEQTAQRFVQNPLNRHYPELIYRTGDLARYNSRGELMFAGRKDFQIKYQGHRIELEEIEQAISAILDVERACCVFDEEKSRLHAFYVGNIDKKKLYEQLTQTLPSFMIPGTLTAVSAMPMTKNGKIDRAALLMLKRRKKRENH